MTRHVFFKNSFAFSKSSVTASPSAIGKPYPQIVQDIFLSPFLFFLYIQYAEFRRQQNAAGKQICGASRPASTPRQACSLECIAKLRFAFQPESLVGRHLKKAAAASTPSPHASQKPSFRLDRPALPAKLSLQSTMLSGRHYFPPGASRPTTFRRISFHTSPHSL